MKAKVIAYRGDERDSNRLEYSVIFNGVPMPGQSFLAHQNEVVGTIRSVGWLTYGNLENNAEMDCLVMVERV